MIKKSPLFLLAATLLLASCSSGKSSYSGLSSSATSATTQTSASLSSEPSESSLSSSASSSASSQAFDFAPYQQKYGTFSVDPGEFGSYTYDESSSTYTFAVAESKAEYTIKGAFMGSIVIDNVNNLSSYKGVKITFNEAAIVSFANSQAAIVYKPESKNVEIKAQKGTNNEIVSLGASSAVYSKKNIEFSGKGKLVATAIPSSASDTPHTFEADGDMAFGSAIELTVVNSAHDAFHGKHLSFEDDDAVAYSGKLTVTNAASQAFDFETNQGKGSIAIQGGTIVVNGAASVFKTDATLDIASGVTVTASDLSEDPVVAGDASTGLTVNNQGTFTVDGEPYVFSA